MNNACHMRDGGEVGCKAIAAIQFGLRRRADGGASAVRPSGVNVYLRQFFLILNRIRTIEK